MNHFGNVKIKWQQPFLIFLLLITVLTSYCKKKEKVQPELSVSSSEVNLQLEGGVSSITITNNGKLTFSSLAALWGQLNQTTGNEVGL